MGRKPRKEQDRETEVFVIVGEEDKEFFLWKRKNSRQAYREYAGEKNRKTIAMFRRAKQTGRWPKMFLLEELCVKPKEAYPYIVSWTKYFIDKGYTPTAETKTVRYTRDLLEESQKLYAAIKDRPIEEVLLPEKCIVDRYKKEKKGSRGSEVSITIRVKPKEHLEIKRRAERNKMSVSSYCRSNVLSGRIINQEPIPLWEFTGAVREATDQLKEIAWNIRSDKECKAETLNIIMQAKDVISAQLDLLTEAYEKHTNTLIKLMT